MTNQHKPHTKLKLTKTESLLTSLFAVPAILLVLSTPACSYLNGTGVKDSGAVSAPSYPVLDKLKQDDVLFRNAIQSGSAVEVYLRDNPEYQKELQRIAALTATTLEQAVHSVFLISTEGGRGSGTVIACIPYLAAIEPVASATATNDGHIPWSLEETKPVTKELPQPRYAYKYKIFVLTARHVIENEVVVLVPRPMPEPELIPEPQPQPQPDPLPEPAPPEEEPSPDEPNKDSDEAPAAPQQEFDIYTIIVLAEDITAYDINGDVVLSGGKVLSMPEDGSDAAILEFMSDVPIATVPLISEPLKLTQLVYTAGYGGSSEEFWISQGLVCDPDGRTTSPITFGDSGGALLDASGRLAGTLMAIEVVRTPLGPDILYYHMLFTSVTSIENWISIEFSRALMQSIARSP
jgi:hypothetical protein